MAKGRASDRNCVCTEMFVHGGEVSAQALTDFFNQMLESGVVPTDWKETHLILLHKDRST